MIEMDKIQRMRFTTNDDICLLKEVAQYKPFENVGQWTAIQGRLTQATGKCFSIRTLREHVDHLLKLFVKNDMGNLRKSGTQIQYEEKEHLLNEIKMLWSEYKADSSLRRRSKALKSPIATIKSEAEEFISLEYSISMPKEEPSLPELTETQTTNTLSESIYSTKASQTNSGSQQSKQDLKRKRMSPILCERLKWEISIKRQNLLLQEKKLKLEERRLTLEEEKFELEKKERENRLQIEVKERENYILISQQQQNIISLFIKQLKKT